MPETKLISTKTNINVSGSSISIHTYYSEPTETFLQFFVPLADTTTGGVNFVGGDLGYTIENLTDLFEINQSGELIVSSIYSEKYSIDENGDLIYTE
jgi:hypothetical protein